MGQLAVAYLRTSTAEQGDSLRNQRSRLQKWAESHGVEIVAFFEEEISGGTPALGRPELAAALEHFHGLPKSEKGAPHLLLVTELSRLSRLGPSAQEELRLLLLLRGAVPLSITGEGTSATGEGSEFTQDLLSLVAREERRRLRERIKSALDAKRTRGERLGNLAWGFREGEPRLLEDGRRVRTVEPCPAERRLLKRVQRYRKQGLGVVYIRRKLNARGGVNPRTERPWVSGSVQKLIRAADSL